LQNRLRPLHQTSTLSSTIFSNLLLYRVATSR
jgi:hypothetical protein